MTDNPVYSAPQPEPAQPIYSTPATQPTIPWAPQPSLPLTEPKPDPHYLELKAIAERVRAECSDSAVTERCCIVDSLNDYLDAPLRDHRHYIFVNDTFAKDYAKGGVRYAVLSSLVRDLFCSVHPRCPHCGSGDVSECDGCCELIMPERLIDPVEAVVCALDNLNDRAD